MVKYHLIATPGDNSHALVLGAGMAGLLAGRILTDHFSRVTIIERDCHAAGSEVRPAVRCQAILENLFPGITTELSDAEAPTVHWTADSPMLLPAGWTPRFQSELMTRTSTRGLLQGIVRERLQDYGSGRVNILAGRRVAGLAWDANQTGVIGAYIEHEHTPEIIEADLVVDTTGRESCTAQWLQAAGYPAVEQTVVNPLLGCATRIYQRPPDFPGDWKVLILMPKPGVSNRGGLIYPVEDDRWVVTIFGFQRDYPPQSDDEFLAFARSLRSPALYEAIKGATPLTPACSQQRTENRIRHYERLSRWPEGLVVMGDAACAYNPIHGQGMTSAGLAARILNECLDDQRKHHLDGSLAGLGQRFQKRLAKSNRVPWLITTAEDYRWPATEGAAPDRLTRSARWYTDQIMNVSVNHAGAFQTFFEVTNRITPPLALLSPRLLARVLHRAVTAHHSNAESAPMPPLFWREDDTAYALPRN